MSAMNLSDIQGLVLHSYRRLPHASYVLLRFGPSPQAAQRWLAEFVEERRIDTAEPKESGPAGSPQVRLNIALTATGLTALGLDQNALGTFPLEFIEGLGVPWPDPSMPDHRSRILGDVAENRPALWDWGYQDDDRRVDALLLAFSKDPVILDLQITGWLRRGESSGAVLRHSTRTLWGELPDDPSQPNREPFGFVDGISQPILKGASRARRSGRSRHAAAQEIDDGELLMGHRDGSRQLARSPTVSADADPHNALPAAPEGDCRRDLGFNGTYLVFRQLAQDVGGFQLACQQSAATLGLHPKHVAAMVVGRWPEGSPLISAPIEHDARLAATPAANDFTYGGDPHGERCPVGAHIRRANPRDSLGDNLSTSLTVANRHRILRRGRPYRLSREQGLHFICLNASISRQFEFIQQNWINNTTFGGLLQEDDPLIGSRAGSAGVGNQTIPPPPEDRLARRVTDLHRYVTVKGGGYFFLPSLTALRYLSRATLYPDRPTPRDAAPQVVAAADRLRTFVLARFSILSALVLAAAPLGIFSPVAAPIVRPTFDLDRPWEMLVVAALASLAAAGAHLTFRVVQLYARARFDVNAAAPPLTWRLVLASQALSIPIVATALWCSVKDAALAYQSTWRAAGWFGAAALGGYAVAFAVLYAAAAARGASVQPDNTEDAMLLPLTPQLARLKRRPSVIAWLAKPAVEFFENRFAMLPATSGRGYVDGSTGRVLPGHLTVLMFVLTLSLFYLVGWWALRPPTRIQLPPLAYILFVMLAVGLTTSAAAFFLDRFRVPLVLLILGWFAFATFIGGTDHEFELHDTLSPARSVVDAIGQSDAFYRNHVGSDPTARPVIVVAAGGGGIRQAAWTAQVLSGLTSLWGRDFSGNLQLVSAVSAGSVGALHFLKDYKTEGPPTQDLLSVRGAETSASGDIWWGLTYPDSLRALFTFPPRPLMSRTMDRGWAIEKAWQQSLGFDTSQTLSGWRDDVSDGWRPATAFNATIVETGERAVLATYELPSGAVAKDAKAITGERDLHMVTAARLSAAFPYVTPVARPTGSRPEQMVHLADGGYWDNSGVVTALEWLREAAGVLEARNILVIQIAPAVLDRPSIHDRAWVWQLTAPLTGLLSVRTAAQQARNAVEIEAFRAAWQSAPGKRLEFVTIGDRGTGPSLGWHISRRERCEVEDQWWNRYVNASDPALATIESILGPRHAGARDAAKDCAQ